MSFNNRLSKIDNKLFKKFHTFYVKKWTQRLLRVNDAAERGLKNLRQRIACDPRVQNAKLSKEGDFDCSTCGYAHGPKDHSKKGLQVITDRYESTSSHKTHDNTRESRNNTRVCKDLLRKKKGHEKSIKAGTESRDGSTQVTVNKKVKERDYSKEAREARSVCFDYKIRNAKGAINASLLTLVQQSCTWE